MWNIWSPSIFDQVLPRGHPANGIALCGYCHRAYDRNIFKLVPDGHVEILSEDGVTQFHSSRIRSDNRVLLIRGVDFEMIGARFRFINY